MATIKQQKAIEKIMENNGNVSKTMREVGYSPNTAKNPQQLMRSKAWQELVVEKLPDEDVLEVHKEQLYATKPFSSHTEPDREIPDNQARLKAIELAYKVKGKFNDTVVAQQININQMGVDFVEDEDKTTQGSDTDSE